VNAAEARADYRRQMTAYGETLTFRRPGGSLPDATVLCRVTGYAPNELVGGIIQGDSRVLALAEDLEAAGWDAPKGGRGNDQIVLSDGRVLAIEAVDDKTRKVGATVIAYEIQARG
jgi:hypothetical protein